MPNDWINLPNFESVNGSWINLPAYASVSWKSPVLTPASLPVLGNSNGDARVNISTNTIYVWSESSWIAVATPGAAIAIDGLTGDITASGPGVVPATVNSVGGSSAASIHSAVVTINNLTFGNMTDTDTDGLSITGGTGAVIGTGVTLSQHVSDSLHNGYLSASDWATFNNKEDKSAANYITNPDAEVNTVGWNLYNNSGRTVPASLTNQDLTYTSALSGSSGNGVEIEYVYNASFSAATPNINVVSSTHVQVQWNNGPTIANNPTATQLKAAWDAVPSALAVATIVISGTPSKLQYITGAEFLGNGGDTSPINGIGGIVTGVTFTRNTATPLVGLASFDLGKDNSNRQGDGVSTDFVINSIDKDKTLQIEFLYQGSSGIILGSSSDVRVFVYDIDNSVLLPVTPVITLAGPVDSPKEFTGLFNSTTGSNYRLILHIATTSATTWDLLLDSIVVTDELNPVAATQVPSLVLQAQPISGAVTDHMCVMWRDGATQWIPATISGAAIPAFGTDQTQLGFATNIIGLSADIFINGFMDGFSFGPFAGFDQYIDNIAGGISPLPSPFTDKYVIVGMAISSTALNIQFNSHIDLISNSTGVPLKGGLLSNSAVNDGTGDQVLQVGANGNVLIANSAQTLGLQWAPAIVAANPFTYTLATRTLTLQSQSANTFLAAPNGSPGSPTARLIVAADIPVLNQNTTGSAATLTTPRTIAGTSFNGSANITLSNKFVVQGTADTGLSGPQFLGALGTGIVKNTTITGVLSIAAASDITGQLITGYVSGAGTVAATDTILQAINKLNGNDVLKANTASPTFTGDINSSTGNLLISTIGKGLQVKTGTNSKIGTAVLVAGVVTVANTSVTANSRIFLTVQSLGTVAVPTPIAVTAKTVNTSFTITSASITDTSTIAWMIVESIP